jgi:hypothetical protein
MSLRAPLWAAAGLLAGSLVLTATLPAGDAATAPAAPGWRPTASTAPITTTPAPTTAAPTTPTPTTPTPTTTTPTTTTPTTTTPTTPTATTPTATTPTTTTPAPATPPRPNPCLVASLHLRCPALLMSAPFELHLDRTTIPGHVLLRASSSIDNHGRGPIELRARRIGRYGTVVHQAIYDRRGRAHLYRTDAKLVFKHIPGERWGYGNVGAASYWKLRHAAAFQLWSIDSNDRAIELVRRGPKVDYCLRDLTRTFPLPRSPRLAVYPGCSQNPHMRHDALGTSVGWSDIYPYAYPQQWIDVTGLHGRFAYVQIVDPGRRLFVSDPSRRVSETYVELPSGRVLGRRVGVSRP